MEKKKGRNNCKRIVETHRKDYVHIKYSTLGKSIAVIMAISAFLFWANYIWNDISLDIAEAGWVFKAFAIVFVAWNALFLLVLHCEMNKKDKDVTEVMAIALATALLVGALTSLAFETLAATFGGFIFGLALGIFMGTWMRCS